MKVFVTGASGKLGSEVAKLFPHCLSPSHRMFDVTRDTLPKVDVVIHCAAMTSVEKCETERAKAYETNVIGTLRMLRGNHYLVYVSTACVFDGLSGQYTELDKPFPCNYYGLTKLLGEEAVTWNHPNSCIVRTNFVARAAWPYPAAFTDRYGTYLYADQVAKAIRIIVDKRLVGIVHVCGKKMMSMYNLAQRLSSKVKPMTMQDYRGKAHLTRDMTLRTVRLKPVDIES